MTETVNGTLTDSPSSTPTYTDSPTLTASPSLSATPTYTDSPTLTASESVTATPTFTDSSTVTMTPTYTDSPTSTVTHTPIVPVETVTAVVAYPATGPTLITLSDFASISVPAGTFDGPVTITVERYTANPSSVPYPGTVVTTSYYSIEMSPVRTINPPGVTLIFPYDPLSIVPGQIPALAYFDGSAWHTVPCVILPGDFLKATVTHFSIWTAVSVATVPTSTPSTPGYTDIAKGKSYPNPFVAGSGALLTIDQVPPTSTSLVRIFSISGRLLATLTKANGGIDASGRAHWDGRAADGQIVSTGIYLYVVKDQSQGRAVKFIVIGK